MVDAHRSRKAPPPGCALSRLTPNPVLDGRSCYSPGTLALTNGSRDARTTLNLCCNSSARDTAARMSGLRASTASTSRLDLDLRTRTTSELERMPRPPLHPRIAPEVLQSDPPITQPSNIRPQASLLPPLGHNCRKSVPVVHRSRIAENIAHWRTLH